MEFLGSISKAEVSSTNLILNGQSAISPFVITANRMTPNFVPCGIPPSTVLHSDDDNIAMMIILQYGYYDNIAI